MCKVIVIIVKIILLANILYSQGPPITTETPIMLGLEGNGLRTFGKLIYNENSRVYLQPIGIPYNITSKFQVGGIFPFVFKTPNGSETIGGFGDMTIFTKYQLYKKDEVAKTFRILANFKQSFPTGKTDTSPAIGSGLYQTYLGLIIGRITTRVGIYGDFGFNITNDNATDNFTYNFSVGTPLLPHRYPQRQINVFFEMNGNYLFDDKIHVLYISPGIQFIPGRRILFESSLQIPALQKIILTGKTKFAIQLGTRFLIN